MINPEPTVFPKAIASNRVCVIIPAYNEAERIAAVIVGVREHLPRVLVVDDGSADNTAATAREAGAEVLRHEVNRGKGESLRDGFDWACENGYEAILALDADGQHLPAEIPLFLSACAQADIVVGNRMAERHNMPFTRWHTNNFMSGLLSRLAGTPLPDSQCGFRLIRASTWRSLQIESSNFDFESEVLVSAGRKGQQIVFVPISTVYAGETSKISPVTDTIRFFKMVWRLWRQSSRADGKQ